MADNNKTLEERSSNLKWAELLVDNGPDAIVTVFCVAFFMLTYKFECVLRGARRLQRINLLLIAITSVLIITRNIGLKLEYLLQSHWITYGINGAVFLISITDIFVLLSNSGKVIRLAAYNHKKPRENWLFSLLIATILSSLVTLYTFELYPSIYYADFFLLTPRSYIYGVFAILVSLASIACNLFFSYIENALTADWAFENECYVQIRHEFKNIRAVSKQAGFNSALKAYAILSLMIWHGDQKIYHSIVLFYLLLTTTVCFFCHKDARFHVFHFLHLDRISFCRTHFGAHKNSRYIVKKHNDLNEIFKTMTDFWEKAYQSQYKDNETPRVKTPPAATAAAAEPTTATAADPGFLQRMGNRKMFWNTIADIIKNRRRRVINPAPISE